MTRRDRLMATLKGAPVDRPAVSFYEIGGWDISPNDDEFCVWNDPSWRPLERLAKEETDIIRMLGVGWHGGSDNGLSELTEVKKWRDGDSLFTTTTIHAPGQTLTSRCRRDKDTQTTWTLEHLLKSDADVEAYLRLPEPDIGEPVVADLLAQEEALGEAGIVSIEMSDPLCGAASLFSMEDYTIAAMTQPALFHRLLERLARRILPQCEALAQVLPGRLWRICGSEYASEPYLPPRLYDEYVVRYTGEMVKSIQGHGGYARIHSHGRLRGILPSIEKMGPRGLDPIEPPPQGDMTLAQVRQAIGGQAVLFGNIEASDIENLDLVDFEKKVVTALREGTAGEGRGFVLMPSAGPYGRHISDRVLRNYQAMIRLATTWG